MSYYIPDKRYFIDEAAKVSFSKDFSIFKKTVKVLDVTLKRIGSGAFRVVYKTEGMPYIIKVCRGDSGFPNFEEYVQYTRSRPEERRYMARPYAISASGHLLMSEYVAYKAKGKDIQWIRKRLPPHLRNDVHTNNVRVTSRGVPKLIDLQSYSITNFPGGSGAVLYTYNTDGSRVYFT